MKPESHVGRKEHSTDERFRRLATRSLSEGVPVDELQLMEPDAEQVNELRDGAKKELLAMAGLTPEQVAAVLKSAKEGGAEGPALVPGAEPEAASAAPQAPEKVLTADQRADLLSRLEAHFTATPQRYKDIQWSAVQRSLEAAGDQALYGLFQMEENGHEVGVTKVEKDGRKGFRFDSCSEESPDGKRDVYYFQAERIANKDWGVPLMSPEVFEELRTAGIITNRATWDYIKTENPGTPQKHTAWYGCSYGIIKTGAPEPLHNGGFRCSLWVPEAYSSSPSSTRGRI